MGMVILIGVSIFFGVIATIIVSENGLSLTGLVLNFIVVAFFTGFLYLIVATIISRSKDTEQDPNVAIDSSKIIGNSGKSISIDSNWEVMKFPEW